MAERTLVRLIHRLSLAFGPGELHEVQIRRLLRAYAGIHPWRTRIAVAARIPCLRPIAWACQKYLPKRGTVLDLGCGYGLVLHLLAAVRSDPLWGIEKDESRARIARESLCRWPHVTVRQGDVVAADWPEASGILLLDVLFMIPPLPRVTILNRCVESLRPGGVLLIKDTALAPRWKYGYTHAEEWFKSRCRVYGGATPRQLYYFHGSMLDEFLLPRKFTKIGEDTLPSLTPYPGIFYIYRRS